MTPASTSRPRKDKPESGVYSSPAEAIMALDRGALSVRAKIKVRLTQLRPPAELEAELFGDDGLEARRRLDGGDHAGPGDVQRAAPD